MLRSLALLPMTLWLCACLETGDGDGPGGRVEIGVPDEETGLGFVPLEPGGDVPLESFGQGGTHAALAVRCIGFGERAFVDVTLENIETGETVMTLPSSRPPLLLCRDENVCDLIPLNVLTGGLADPDEKDGLAIRVRADVRNEAGQRGSAEVEAVLRDLSAVPLEPAGDDTLGSAGSGPEDAGVELEDASVGDGPADGLPADAG